MRDERVTFSALLERDAFVLAADVGDTVKGVVLALVDAR